MYIFYDKINGDIINITYPVTDVDDPWYGKSLDEMVGDDIGYKDYPDASGTETNISQLTQTEATWEEIDLEREKYMDTWLPRIGGRITLADTNTVSAQATLKTKYAAVKACASGVATIKSNCIGTIREADAASASATGLESAFITDVVVSYEVSNVLRYFVDNAGGGNGIYHSSSDYRKFVEADLSTHYYMESDPDHCIYYREDWDGTGFCIYYSEPDEGWVLGEWDGTTGHDINGETGPGITFFPSSTEDACEGSDSEITDDNWFSITVTLMDADTPPYTSYRYTSGNPSYGQDGVYTRSTDYWELVEGGYPSIVYLNEGGKAVYYHEDYTNTGWVLIYNGVMGFWTCGNFNGDPGHWLGAGVGYDNGPCEPVAGADMSFATNTHPGSVSWGYGSIAKA